MSLPDLNKRRASLLGAVFEPGQDKADRFEISLDGRELMALGYGVAQWSLLEESIRQFTQDAAEALGIDLPQEASQDAFRKRLKSLTIVVSYIPEPDMKKHYETIISKIANANAMRQRIVHGIWEFDLADPDFLIVEKPGSGGPTLLNVEKIITFAQDVGRLSVALLYPEGLTWEIFARQREQDQSLITRAGVRALMGRDLSSK